MKEALTAVKEHLAAGNSHPLCIDEREFKTMLLELHEMAVIDADQFKRSYNEQRIKLSGVLVIPFSIKHH